MSTERKDGKEAPNWIMHDLDALSRPALESVANSRWMAKTVKHLHSKGEHKHALSLTSGAHEALQKNLLPGLIKLRTLDPLEPQDFSIAFDKLFNLKGFEEWRPQMTSLKNRIESLQERKADLQKNRALFHAVLLSPDDSKLAEDFVLHYHAVLLACGAFSSGENIVRADGTNDRALDQAHGCGMCLIENAEQLSSGATDELGTRMRSPDVVFIANYTDSEDVSPKFLEERFFLRFDFLEALSKNATGTILESVKTWSEENQKELEGGLDGIYARTFATRIAENKDNEDGSMEDRLKVALADVLARQDVRLELSHVNNIKADQSSVSRSDLLGQEPDINSFKNPAWEKLQNLIGLDDVKASLRSFLNGVLLDYHREMQGMKPLRSGLSRLFLGPPGTGKTTVGKLYGEILSRFGLLLSGEFVFKNATDFIGPYLGQSEERTKKIIRAAKGKVLMIDEAYMLDPYRAEFSAGADPYRQAAIDALVGEVQNSPGEDLCVIMCGYKEEIELMLQRANPGLARRFPVADAFIFEDFELPELERILELKMEKEVGCSMTPEAKKLAMEKLNIAKQQPRFGNGGEIDNLLGRAMANFRKRFNDVAPPPEGQSGDVCFEPEDIDPMFKEVFQVEDRIDSLFNGLTDVQDLKDCFRGLARRSTSLRSNGRNPRRFMPFHFIFKGTESTGKKTVAKKLSSLYHTMRLLPTNQVFETSARELLSNSLPGGFGRGVPRSTSKVLEMMDNALGKVLFIDEAHSLAGSINDQTETSLQDVRAELIETINKPKYFGQMVVILAGYETPVDRLLTEHTLFARRFRVKLQFRPLASDACYDILQNQLQAEDVAVNLTVEEQLEIKKAFGSLSEARQWASVDEIQEVTNQLVGDAFEKDLGKDCQPSITGSEILQVLRAQYPQLSHPAENLRRLNEERQRLNHVVTEKKAQEALDTEIDHDDASLVPQNAPLEPFEYPELLRGRYVRVLHLLPSVSYDDIISCDIEVIYLDGSLDEQCTFTAVSYVCGSQNRTQAISCNGKKFLTTRNSELVLRNLRQKEAPCTLWIDSICINQQSTPERNEQVSFMGDIYQKAKDVYIWLGVGSPETHEALNRFKELYKNLEKEADKAEEEESESDVVKEVSVQEIRLPMQPNEFVAMREVMKNQWWQRLWTFQEFVVGNKPILVMGHVHISWADFYAIATILVTQKEDDERNNRDSGTNDRSLPNDQDIIWVEVAEAVMARRAYQERLPENLRPLSMSHFLIKTRNRKADNPRDKLYGLYYLFTTFGYQLPKINYDEDVAEIYKEISLRLVRQSRSWWILTHLFNRRNISTLGLPSWVPDFNTHAVWHQQANVRFQNANDLVDTLAEEAEESPADETFGGTFSLEEHLGAIKTTAIFLWTVTAATPEMPANAALDLTLESSFDLLASDVLEYAKEDFLFILASWLKLFDSIDNSNVQPLESERDTATEAQEGFASHNEGEMMKAVACAFYRSSAGMLRTATKKFKEKIKSQPDEEPKLMKAKSQALDFQVAAAHVLPNIMNNIRRCMSPDERHPCRKCRTKAPHKSGEAADHLFEWWTENLGANTLDVILLLYSRAIDHSLFQTNATGRCGGHFGFCRNLPRAGDDVVLLPGLPDPVILRRRPGVRPGEVDSYRVVGVTTGMVGPPVLDIKGEEVKGDFCFGSCPEIEGLKERESRSFYLV